MDVVRMSVTAATHQARTDRFHPCRGTVADRIVMSTYTGFSTAARPAGRRELALCPHPVENYVDTWRLVDGGPHRTVAPRAKGTSDPARSTALVRRGVMGLQ